MNRMPYTVRMLLSRLEGNGEAANKAMEECMTSATGNILKVARMYDELDLPFVIAAMKVVAETMKNTLTESGKDLVDFAVESTTCIAVNVSEIERRSKSEQKRRDNEEKKTEDKKCDEEC